MLQDENGKGCIKLAFKIILCDEPWIRDILFSVVQHTVRNIRPNNITTDCVDQCLRHPPHAATEIEHTMFWLNQTLLPQKRNDKVSFFLEFFGIRGVRSKNNSYQSSNALQVRYSHFQRIPRSCAPANSLLLKRTLLHIKYSSTGS